MGNSPGAQQNPMYCMLANGLNVSLDGGVTSNPVAGGAGSVPLSNLAAQADQTAVGNVSGGAASPVALTKTQLTTLVNPATTALPGAQPVNSYILTPPRGADLTDADATIQPGSDKASMYWPADRRPDSKTGMLTLTMGITVLAAADGILDHPASSIFPDHQERRRDNPGDCRREWPYFCASVLSMPEPIISP